MGLSQSIKFDSANDLIMYGDCDEAVERICQETGWKEDLDNIQVEVMEP